MKKTNTMGIIVRIDKKTGARRPAFNWKTWATFAAAQRHYNMISSKKFEKYDYELQQLPRVYEDDSHMIYMMVKHNEDWQE